MLKPPLTHILILLAFLANILGPLPTVQADEFVLPKPGAMVHLSPQFKPPVLKGIKVHPNNPFRFDFILDKGNSRQSDGQIKEESKKIIKYFLASLTIPEKDLWVNLSPYERDRIVPESFGTTEMGRDLLVEDYMLKQITASLIYPEDAIGKKFWRRIYEEAAKKYEVTNIPVNTFNKVWIVPERAVVYENAKTGTAYVVESKLKVMLEQDYLSLEKHEGIQSVVSQSKDTNQLGSQIVREVVIPELTKEVNENKNFAQLRQVYNSLILATWYKKKIKDSILSQVYVDKNKVAGINIDDPQEKQEIYQRYLQAFKKGVYNYIKEEYDPATQQSMPRKYFSGGLAFDKAMQVVLKIVPDIDQAQVINRDLIWVTTDFAMLNNPNREPRNWVVESKTFKVPPVIVSRPQSIENRGHTEHLVRKGDKTGLLQHFFKLNNAPDEFFSPGDLIYHLNIGVGSMTITYWRDELRRKIRGYLDHNRLKLKGCVTYENMPEKIRNSLLKAQLILEDEFPRIFSRPFTKDLREYVLLKDEYIPQANHVDPILQKVILDKRAEEFNDNQLVRLIIHEVLHLESRSDDVLMGLNYTILVESIIEYFTQQIMFSESANSLNVQYDSKDADPETYGGLYVPYFKRIFIQGLSSEKPVLNFYLTGNLLQFSQEISRVVEKSGRAIEGIIRGIKPQDGEDLNESEYRVRTRLLQAFDYILHLSDSAQLSIQKRPALFTKAPTDQTSKRGGIDFTTNKTPLEIQNAGEGIKFHLDPAMLEQFRNAHGFVPVIISMQPIGNLRAFFDLPN